MERARYSSPFGAIELAVDDGRLVSVRLIKRAGRTRARRRKPSDEMQRVLDALDRYCRGLDPALPAGMMDQPGQTPFARRVYEELCKVRFGATVTYGELAARAGSPGGARAVGQVKGRNPLPVFVPCHRVITSGGGLGGFGAGLRWKRDLLRHEGWAVTEDRCSER